MIKARNSRLKSRIAVMKGSSLENKENVLCNANRKGNVDTIKQLSNRKILTGRNSVEDISKKALKPQKVKSAPDFKKLHQKWESKLAKRKATTKRPNTKIEPFNLTKKTPGKYENDETSYGMQSELDDGCHENDTSPTRSSNETATNSLQKTGILDYGERLAEENKQMTSPATTQDFKVPKSFRKVNLSSVKKESVQNDQDLLDFQPDNAALQSILNNVGVDELKIRTTPNKRNTGYFCSPLPFKQKRTSIYYTGPDPNRPLSGFEQRLIRRRVTRLDELRKGRPVATPSLHRFEPSKTLVGIQNMGGRFSVTPQKELPITKKGNFIPRVREETSQDNTVFSVQKNSNGTSDAASLTEMTWADTLKSYSQFSSSDACETSPSNKSEDTEALIAQLEEEVNRNLAEMQLKDHENTITDGHRPLHDDISTRVTNMEYLRNTCLCSDYSSCFSDEHRGKPSLFRELFPSPSPNVQENSKAQELFVSSSCTKITSTRDILTNCRKKVEKEPEYPTQRYRAASPIAFRALQNAKMDLNSGNSLHQKQSSVPFPLLPSKDIQRNWRQDKVAQDTRSAPATNLSLCEKHQTSGLFSTGTIYNGKSDVQCISLNTNLNTQSDSEFSRQTINQSSAFTRRRSSNTITTNDMLDNVGSRISDKVRVGLEIVVPTPQRPVISNKPSDDVNLNGTPASGFISRHRQIVHDALAKSRHHAEEILLDAEVSLYARHIEHLQKSEQSQRLENPLAKLFRRGDHMHFVPVNE